MVFYELLTADIRKRFEKILFSGFGTIFHYTDLSALLGILESNKIWATNAAYLNDKQEMEYAFSIINLIIQDYIRQRNNENREFFKELQEFFLQNKIPDVYVISFTKKK